MGLDLGFLQQHFPELLVPALNRGGGATAYRLQLPDFRPGREFAWAELRLPKGFPEHAQAKIYLSPDAVLRIPHVEWGGALCTEGDPGPASGLSAEERILLLLTAYHENFLRKWITGALDEDFAGEVLNYWGIEVAKSRTQSDPVRQVWTVDSCPDQAVLRQGTLLVPERVVIAADDQLPITSRLIAAMGASAKQRIGVLVADIPIAHTLAPQTWPRNLFDLEALLYSRLAPRDYSLFHGAVSRRGRSVHRIVLLRNTECSFAYLLPGGPPTVVVDGNRKKTYPPSLTPQPLNVARLDPAWTVGRDMHPEVEGRQEKHILVLGAGALGSPVIDHLAKAGVGFITVLDPEDLAPQNIGRHLLGAESIGRPKATTLARRINASYPATVVTPHTIKAETWLRNHTLDSIDVVLDLTGEPDVRWHIDQARREHPCPLLIGWMEPYVAAAHVCVLPSETRWLQGNEDLLTRLEAIRWPAEVIRQEPGCSSRFQSYTATAAAHAVALVAENALDLIDRAPDTAEARVISWVRGQRYLDRHYPGLHLEQWAESAALHDGLILTRTFP